MFPRSARDLDMSCSCPDWEAPCKHLAATCHLLAEAFDDDPFLMFAWRGRSQGDLLTSLRRIMADQADQAAVASAASAAQDPAAAPPVIDATLPPLAECLDNFWSPAISHAALRARPVTPAAAPDVLLRTFAPPPIDVRGRDLW